MKHRLTTLIYLIGNVLFIALRTVQILFFTEKGTAFLTTNSMPFSVAFSILFVAIIATSFSFALFSNKRLREVPENSYPCLIVCLIVGALYLVSGLVSYLLYSAGIFFALISVLAAASMVLYGFTEFKGYEFPRFGSLFLIAVWSWQFILSYLCYTTRPLRLRTVVETFAIITLILFFLLFGKLKSNVDLNKSSRLLHPLGLVASTLCFASIVPEFIAWTLGNTDKLTFSCLSPVSLLAGGIFAAFISIYTFKSDDRDILPDNEIIDDIGEFKIVNISLNENK